MAAALVIAIAGTGAVSERATTPLDQRTVTSGEYSQEESAAKSRLVADPAVRSETCPSAHRAVRFYARRLNEHRARMGAPREPTARPTGCPRYLAHVLQRKARAWRVRAERWHAYHYDWQSWLPDKWQRVGACETGYGRRPGRWDWNSGTYQGAFGFFYGSWDAFVRYADRRAGPYPSEAYLATPRQQYEVALAIWRRYGFSGWGCRGA